ncbi:MAG: sulfatase-like hydrolase/transferase, partial [Pseudomonadota bacterium]
MWKRIFVGIVVCVFIGVGLAWLNRVSILLHVASTTGKLEVAENRPVTWVQGPAQPETDRSEGPPNIVFILADDLGINDISAFGGGVAGGRVPTPNIDRLAAEGAMFSNAYSGAATCAPSRAMLMTGRYPTRTGFEFTPAPAAMSRIIPLLMTNEHKEAGLPPLRVNPAFAESGIEYRDMGLPPEEVTIAEVLKPTGYHSVHIGKWHLGRNAPFRAVRQGFDESLLMGSGLFLPEDDPNAVNAKLEFDPLDVFLWARMQFAVDYDRAGEDETEDMFQPAKYITDYYTDEALNVIEANKHQPFFLYLAHFGVHTPLQATREDFEAVGEIEPHRLRVYAAMVRALDRSVGRILDKLEAEGLTDNTIVVFSSDNGGAGYLGLEGLNAPYRGWKATLFEGGIRVPLFIKWPRKIDGGAVVDAAVAHVDLMPTFAAAAGASIPVGTVIDGQDILPLATGGSATLARPDDALYWSSGFYKAVRSGQWKLQINERQDKAWLINLEE